MLRELRNRQRVLKLDRDRSSWHRLQSGHVHNYSVLRHHGPSPFRAPNTSIKYSWNDYCIKNFYTLAKKSTSHYAPYSWKTQNLVNTFHYTKIPHLKTHDSRRVSYAKNFHAQAKNNKLVCALSLCFTRYHVVPGILTLFFAEAATGQKYWADGFCSKAEDSYELLSSYIFSIFEFFILVFRSIYLAILFSPSIALAPFADSVGVDLRKIWLRIVHTTLEKAGPAFIKWGQWAATRPDLFPKDLCLELAKLHSKAPAHSFAYSKLTIEKAFGRKLLEIFENFEETPVASGSIAQVHQATLKYQYPGQKLKKPIAVAVKVRHPGVGESIRRDFVIINVAAKISNFIPGLSWLRLDESVRQFAVYMMSQVDLAREAAHLSRFIYNFRKNNNVSFPKPLYPLVHPSVLVETYEEGDSISLYVEGHKGDDHIKRDIAQIGTHALLKMLLEDNFVHADMHPGNILVRTPQEKTSRRKLFRRKPHIIFLDVGLTAELYKDDQLNLVEFFRAVALRDGRSAANCALRFSKRQSCPNPSAFIEEMETKFTFWGTPEGEAIHPVECMHQLLDAVRRHKVNVDGNVCTVMVTILVLEGWQHKLDPDYDIMHTLKKLLLVDSIVQPKDYYF